MKQKAEELEKRIDHFQSVYRYMLKNHKTYYLEKDWFDDIQELTISDVWDEVLISRNKLISKKRSFIKNILQRLHRLFHRLLG